MTATKPQWYAIRGAQALSIAQADAERVYGDLSPFQIEVRLEPDGWHVDYQPSRPTMKGGGPSYVIDPATGDIVQKKYEQ
jgi:hypothetical protein